MVMVLAEKVYMGQNSQMKISSDNFSEAGMRIRRDGAFRT